jgi:hypothetical protein
MTRSLKNDAERRDAYRRDDSGTQIKPIEVSKRRVQ